MQLPLTLRLLYHGVRSFVRAGLLFFIAWVIFIPANAEERAALNAPEAQQYPLGLRPMRSARAIFLVAPDRTYDLMARAMGPEISPLLLRLVISQMAAGNVLPAGVQTDPDNNSDRDMDGARFIKVD